jgi:hypothetical protein
MARLNDLQLCQPNVVKKSRPLIRPGHIPVFHHSIEPELLSTRFFHTIP